MSVRLFPRFSIASYCIANHFFLILSGCDTGTVDVVENALDLLVASGQIPGLEFGSEKAPAELPGDGAGLAGYFYLCYWRLELAWCILVFLLSVPTLEPMYELEYFCKTYSTLHGYTWVFFPASLMVKVEYSETSIFTYWNWGKEKKIFSKFWRSKSLFHPDLYFSQYLLDLFLLLGSYGGFWRSIVCARYE